MTTKDDWYTDQDETIADYKFRMAQQAERADMRCGNWHIEVRIVSTYADGWSGGVDLPTFIVYAHGIHEALGKALCVLQCTWRNPDGSARDSSDFPDKDAEHGSIDARNPNHKNTTATYHITATF